MIMINLVFDTFSPGSLDTILLGAWSMSFSSIKIFNYVLCIKSCHIVGWAINAPTKCDQNCRDLVHSTDQIHSNKLTNKLNGKLESATILSAPTLLNFYLIFKYEVETQTFSVQILSLSRLVWTFSSLNQYILIRYNTDTNLMYISKDIC